MKSDVAFALENAGWPALLVDGGGAICRANPAASQPVRRGPRRRVSAPGGDLVAGEQQHGGQFLAQWERSAAPTVPLKFRGKGGQHGGLSHLDLCRSPKTARSISCFSCCGRARPPRRKLKPPGGEAGLAHKQKLDCALQLARTVALDFNNALTSILGHTSLVLSKMEPNHPWRGSLIEVEKSAAKAAEIANDLGTFSRQEKEARAQAAGNLNLLLQRSVEFFQQNAGPEPVDWTLQLDRKLFAAKFDEAKMQQAFMKILENALQALRERGPHHRPDAQHRTGRADAGPQRAIGRRRLCLRGNQRQRLRHRAGGAAAGV